MGGRIIKEFYEKKAVKADGGAGYDTQTVCRLRFDDGKPLKLRSLDALFNAAAADFPGIGKNDVYVFNTAIVLARAPTAAYKKVPFKSAVDYKSPHIRRKPLAAG